MMITKPTRYQTAGLLLLLGLALPFALRAQNNPSVPDSAPAQQVISDKPEADSKPLTNFVESGGSYQTLTNGYGYWGGGYMRAVYENGADVWDG